MSHFNEEEIKKSVGRLWLGIWSFFYWWGEPPIPKLWKPLHLINLSAGEWYASQRALLLFQGWFSFLIKWMEDLLIKTMKTYLR